MLCLAKAQTGRPLTKYSIADAEGISSHYVGQILMTLKHAGLVRSQQGAEGGFTLARDPSTISVAEVVEAVDGPICLVPCTELADACDRTSLCVTRAVWQEAGRALRDVLAGAILAKLAEEAKKSGANKAPAFEI